MCCVDAKWAKQKKLPLRPLSHTQLFMGLGGRPLSMGVIKDTMELLKMRVAHRGHSELIRFCLRNSPAYLVMLGHSSLVQHKLQENWRNRMNIICGGGRSVFLIACGLWR